MVKKNNGEKHFGHIFLLSLFISLSNGASLNDANKISSDHYVDIVAKDCALVEQTLHKLSEILDQTFKSNATTLKFFVIRLAAAAANTTATATASTRSTCLIDVDLGSSSRSNGGSFKLNYVILVKLLRFLSLNINVDDDNNDGESNEVDSISFLCTSLQEASDEEDEDSFPRQVALNMNRKSSALVKSMYGSLAANDLTQCDEDETNKMQISESQIEPFYQKSVIKLRDESYTRRLKSETVAVVSSASASSASSTQSIARKNYYIYVVICVLMVIFLLLIGLSLLYKLNRAIISRHKRRRRRRPPVNGSDEKFIVDHAGAPTSIVMMAGSASSRCNLVNKTNNANNNYNSSANNPFEFPFNLFDRPVKSEYEYGGYYFGLEDNNGVVAVAAPTSRRSRSTEKNTNSSNYEKHNNTSHTFTSTINNTSLSAADKKEQLNSSDFVLGNKGNTNSLTIQTKQKQQHLQNSKETTPNDRVFIFPSIEHNDCGEEEEEEESTDPELDSIERRRQHLAAAARAVASSHGGLMPNDLNNQQDGDTRSEYSITDYERMKFVQEWLNSISMFRFLRVNSASYCENNNTNNKNNTDVAVNQPSAVNYSISIETSPTTSTNNTTSINQQSLRTYEF